MTVQELIDRLSALSAEDKAKIIVTEGCNFCQHDIIDEFEISDDQVKLIIDQ